MKAVIRELEIRELERKKEKVRIKWGKAVNIEYRTRNVELRRAGLYGHYQR
jgi:hypothetical protein